MASKFVSLPCIIPFLVILFSTHSLAQYVVPPSTPLAPDTMCSNTLYPSYCKSIFPRGRRESIYEYSRSSVGQSLWSARRFSSLIDRYLAKPSILSSSAVKALEDCKLLAGLTTDFLTSTSTTLNFTESLRSSQTEYLQALLSAILTNQQTCLDGLQVADSARNVRDGLSAYLSNGTKIYSLSLSLFNRGWGRKRRGKLGLGMQGRKLLFSNVKVGPNGELPLRMARHHREKYESVSKRKILQTSSASVLVRDMVVVNPDGSGNFTTINDAIVAAPNNTNIADGYFMIYVVAGVYKEYVTIDKKKKNCMIVGDGIDQTVITGNRSVVDGWTTFNSATFAVVGQGFVGINITIRNTAGAINHQAVALRNGADLSTFQSCSFDAYQDTLYTHSLRQVYRECDIYGTVDFIFGNAAVVLQNCNIYARLPMKGQFNALTAQGRTDPSQTTGTSIHNCTIKAAPDLAASNGTTKTYLGRPWKEYSRTVYMQSYIDSVIDPAGWREWDGTFALSTLYYGEYDNRGPGSNTDNRVNWSGYSKNIGYTNATIFTVSNFTLGDSWLPATGVPYSAGLI